MSETEPTAKETEVTSNRRSKRIQKQVKMNYAESTNSDNDEVEMVNAHAGKLRKIKRAAELGRRPGIIKLAHLMTGRTIPETRPVTTVPIMIREQPRIWTNHLPLRTESAETREMRRRSRRRIRDALTSEQNRAANEALINKRKYQEEIQIEDKIRKERQEREEAEAPCRKKANQKTTRMIRLERTKHVQKQKDSLLSRLFGHII